MQTSFGLHGMIELSTKLPRQKPINKPDKPKHHYADENWQRWMQLKHPSIWTEANQAELKKTRQPGQRT